MKKYLSAGLFCIVILSVGILFAGEKGDEEGEYFGGTWPADVPKKSPVEFYLPFPAGKSFGQLPGAASHTALQNKYAIDFSMPIGSPVCASADGIIVKIIESGPDRGGRQNSLILEHADGKCTCYLHLKNKGVPGKLGDFVYQGDVVAYSGASGTGVPHLHFSVNKAEMLESIPIEFVEGKSRKQWVSQNCTFEQKYGKKLADFRKTELMISLGPRLGLWDGSVEARKHVDELKPEEKDDIRLKRRYENLEKTAGEYDKALESFLKSSETAMSKDDAEALWLASCGSEDFGGTDHEKLFKEKLAHIKKLDNYGELEKALKKQKDIRKRLEKAFASDLKNKSVKKALKEYMSFEKKYRDEPETAVVKKRIEILKAEYEKSK